MIFYNKFFLKQFPGYKKEMAAKILVLPTAFLPLSNVCVFENTKVFFLKFL